MNAALISGFATGLAGVVAHNAWYYWHLQRLRWLAVALEAGGSLLLGWGAGMAHKSIILVLPAAAAFLAAAGSLAFVGLALYGIFEAVKILLSL